MTTIEVLKKARDLVATGWCQGVGYCEEDGKPMFCSIGALQTAGRFEALGYAEAFAFLRKALPPTAKGSIVEYNDSAWRTQEDVVGVFDTAIALAEAREGGSETVTAPPTPPSRPRRGRKSLRLGSFL